jgi:hypothetical protein
MRIAFAPLLLLSLAAGCGPGRTAAATQPTGPKAFDPAASDAQAVIIADQVIAAAGGEANWAKAKELHWTHAILVDGKIVYLVHHDWDRWNGRHRMEKYMENGGANVVQHDLYDGTGTAFIVNEEGNPQELRREDINNMKNEGTTRLWTDAYMLVLPFKLKDPGVHLKYKQERGEPPAAPATPDAPPAPVVPKWDVIRVTFDQGVAGDASEIYELSVNKQTHMIDVVDKIRVEDGKEKFIGYNLEGWTDVGGIKIATRWNNIGYGKDSPQVPLAVPEAWKEDVPAGLTVPNPGEVIAIVKPTIDSEPDDDLYIPIVTGP